MDKLGTQPADASRRPTRFQRLCEYLGGSLMGLLTGVLLLALLASIYLLAGRK